MLSIRVGLVCLLAAGAAFGQTRPMYLEISKAQIKAERSKEYEDGVRKLVDVNRRFKGDHWIAVSTEYGAESGTYMFSSSRENMAAVQSGMEAFMRSLKEGMGPLGDKLMRDLGGWSNSFKSELRRRRWDLSVHVPEDQAGLQDMVARSRWIRTLRIDVKPGKMTEYLEAWKPWQGELEQVTPPQTALVADAATGTPALFVTLYYKSLADMDEQDAAVQKALASQAYANLAKASGDAVGMTNWEIHRVRPELSNPPDEFIKADPAFWKPQPAAAPVKKTAAAGEKKQ